LRRKSGNIWETVYNTFIFLTSTLWHDLRLSQQLGEIAIPIPLAGFPYGNGIHSSYSVLAWVLILFQASAMDPLVVATGYY